MVLNDSLVRDRERVRERVEEEEEDSNTIEREGKCTFIPYVFSVNIIQPLCVR